MLLVRDKLGITREGCVIIKPAVVKFQIRVCIQNILEKKTGHLVFKVILFTMNFSFVGWMRGLHRLLFR
ncbi:hypothetical protein C3F42_10745 [Pseudomonas sp. PONIH3]|nr:hypothetical protein C3F42_10745 [Pseudomonas sp. PONIH3]